MKKVNETLVITMEECGELVQACSKIIRHYADRVDKRETLLTNLNEEAGDVMAMIGILVEQGLLDQKQLNSRIATKRNKLKKYSNIFN
jgi:NTP pyrophosphatase (non-canonical NTP hydrolase)